MSRKTSDRMMRDQLLELLRGGGAHLKFEDAIADLPPNLHGAKPPGQPHTPWRLLEHMRIAQHDILEFSRNAHYKAPKWPDEFWPTTDGPARASDWEKSVRQFQADNQAMQEMVSDPKTDLLSPILQGQGQTIFREAMLAADHNSYHLGQLVILRRLLGTWED